MGHNIWIGAKKVYWKSDLNLNQEMFRLSKYYGDRNDWHDMHVLNEIRKRLLQRCVLSSLKKLKVNNFVKSEVNMPVDIVKPPDDQILTV